MPHSLEQIQNVLNVTCIQHTKHSVSKSAFTKLPSSYIDKNTGETITRKDPSYSMIVTDSVATAVKSALGGLTGTGQYLRVGNKIVTASNPSRKDISKYNGKEITYPASIILRDEQKQYDLPELGMATVAESLPELP